MGGIAKEGNLAARDDGREARGPKVSKLLPPLRGGFQESSNTRVKVLSAVLVSLKQVKRRAWSRTV